MSSNQIQLKSAILWLEKNSALIVTTLVIAAKPFDYGKHGITICTQCLVVVAQWNDGPKDIMRRKCHFHQ